MTSGVILFALVRLQIKCSLFSDKIIQAVAPNLRSINVWSRNFAKRIHTHYDRHHEVSPNRNVYQNAINYVRHQIIWKLILIASDMNCQRFELYAIL